MENYELQLKPFERKDGYKYKVIRLTDVTLHTSNKRPTKAMGKKIKQAFEQNKPGRFYGIKPHEVMEGGDLPTLINNLVKNDPNFLKMIQEEEKKGYKVLLELPEEGIPAIFGPDTVEFLNSKNGQRIMRDIHKQEI
ncbi:MAG: hypothetical protein PHX30_02095 [Candidatus Pacebacteria bacterium]|nr:hypothetical protein [Candidatus Paceibacterota bacterium]